MTSKLVLLASWQTHFMTSILVTNSQCVNTSGQRLTFWAISLIQVQAVSLTSWLLTFNCTMSNATWQKMEKLDVEYINVANMFTCLKVILLISSTMSTCRFMDYWSPDNWSQDDWSHGRLIAWTIDHMDDWSLEPLIIGRLIAWTIDRMDDWSHRRLIAWTIDRMDDWSHGRLIAWTNDHMDDWSLEPLIIGRLITCTKIITKLLLTTKLDVYKKFIIRIRWWR